MNEPTSVAGPAVAASETLRFRPLRIWPALILVVLIIAARYIPRLFEGATSHYWFIPVFVPLLCCLLILIWWLAASRASWKERLFGFLGLIGGVAMTLALVHPTMRGPGTTYLTVPTGMILFALTAICLRNSRPITRTSLALLLAFGGFSISTLLRSEGMTGDYAFDLRWRWSKTSEDSMLSEKNLQSTTKPAAGTNSADLTQAFAKPEWPGFRGADRAARSSAPPISTNWTAQPPQQLWRIPVGPGWSSFAVAGHVLFTQEQRGTMETVVCYDANTGREIWSRQVEARLDDPMGGPGPRATPTVADGALFVTGATGNLLRLDPVTGEIVWKQDLTAVAGRKVPMWGFAASPLVTGSLAIVYAGGPEDKGLLAFDIASGTLRWSVGGVGNESYSSPQLNTVAGENLVLMLSNDGLLLVDPATGRERLNYLWKFMGYRALQPHVVGDDTILLPTASHFGTRAIRIAKKDNQLAAEELWTSRNLKPDFTDFVTYQGHIFGIDGGIFTCLDLKTGQRKWKGGRYGKGQVVLLENSGLLLVSAEQGDVALLRADPTEFVELASFKALEGKTWNHPVVVRDRLYLRNSQEAAAYRLPLGEPKTAGRAF